MLIAFVTASIAARASKLAVQPTRPTVIYIVRHAEKEAETGNPHLTEAGRRRANELAFMFEQIELDAIFVSVTAKDERIHRTSETVAPLLEAKALSATSYEAMEVRALAKRINERRAGQTMLVCGHSTTIPNMLRAFQLDVEGIEDPLKSYDDLFVVILTRDEEGIVVTRTMQRLRYR